MPDLRIFLLTFCKFHYLDGRLAEICRTISTGCAVDVAFN